MVIKKGLLIKDQQAFLLCIVELPALILRIVISLVIS
jgi:hypothetical protein